MSQTTIVILDVDQDNDPAERKVIHSPTLKGGTGQVIQTNPAFPDMQVDPEGFKKALHAWHVKNNPQWFKE